MASIMHRQMFVISVVWPVVWSVASAAAILVIAGGVTAGCSSPAKKVAGPPEGAAPADRANQGKRVVLASLSEDMRAALEQTAALSASLKPFDVDGLAMQRVPKSARELGVLLVEAMPEVPGIAPLAGTGPFCQLVEGRSLGGLDICDQAGQCARPGADDAPMLLCDGRGFRAFEALLYASHQPAKIASMMADDWTFASFVDKLERDPKAAVSDFAPEIPEEHMSQHLAFVLYFVIGRAGPDLSRRKAGRPWTTQMTAGMKNANKPAHERVCRHYGGFLKHNLVADFGIPAAADDPDGAATKRLNEAWDLALMSDAHGSKVVGTIAKALIDETGMARLVLSDLVTQTFTTWILYDWYRRVGRFAGEHCQHVAGKSFFVARCFCRERKLYLKTGDLFDRTLPPAYLRMTQALILMMGVDDVAEKLDDAGKREIGLRLKLISNLSEVPGKLAAGACLVGDSPDGGQLAFPSMPALDGFLGKSSDDFWGAPPADVQAEITAFCAAP